MPFGFVPKGKIQSWRNKKMQKVVYGVSRVNRDEKLKGILFL